MVEARELSGVQQVCAIWLILQSHYAQYLQSSGLVERRNGIIKTELAARCWWAHICNPCYSEAEIRKITVQSQPQGNSLQAPILKIPNTKKAWWSDSSGRAPA
jgi:hypothetical protein